MHTVIKSVYVKVMKKHVRIKSLDYVGPYSNEFWVQNFPPITRLIINLYALIVFADSVTTFVID